MQTYHVTHTEQNASLASGTLSACLQEVAGFLGGSISEVTHKQAVESGYRIVRG